MTKYVNILRLDDDGRQVVGAVCELVDGVAVVNCTGDEDILERLQEGISNYDRENPKKLTTSDGLAFLDALKNNFHGPYFTATDVREK